MESLVEVKDLYVEYNTVKGVFGKKQIIHAVNGVNLDIRKGEILALAGESGCGKSTLAKAVLRLEPPKSGEIVFHIKKDFIKSAQMVFQNPYASLNPRMRTVDILKEPLEINTDYSKEKILEIVKEKIKMTGLDEDCLNRYPHEFSGGQRQRIAIARALVLEPEFILADEPVSALDVSIQAQIINLIKELKEKCNLTFLLITHDMSVIQYLSDRTAVMYLGEIVEIGRTADIFANPLHPYTKALLSSVPQIKKNGVKKIMLKGDLPSPENLPQGCRFHTRCPHVMEKCKNCSPSPKGSGHTVRCFLYDSVL